MKKGIIILLLITCFANIQPIKGQKIEDRLKGLYVYNISKLIDWPADYKSGDFIITVLGTSKVHEGFVGKSLNSQEIFWQTVKSVSDIGKSHILFIPASESGQLAAVIKKLGSSPTVIITDGEGLVDKGSFINFIVEDGILGIEINKTSMEKCNLKVSADLTQLAKKVI